MGRCHRQGEDVIDRGRMSHMGSGIHHTYTNVNCGFAGGGGRAIAAEKAAALEEHLAPLAGAPE
eukprot:232723-Prorocentrum_minimum.AAC.1